MDITAINMRDLSLISMKECSNSEGQFVLISWLITQVFSYNNTKLPLNITSVTGVCVLPAYCTHTFFRAAKNIHNQSQIGWNRFKPMGEERGGEGRTALTGRR